MAGADGARDAELPQHVLRWLEAAQRRAAHELEAALDGETRSVGLRRLRILQLIPDAGARQQELAERALVTKQAMAEAVAALEADDLVERRPDPRDGRAWLVVRSAQGRRVCSAMNRSMAAIEKDLAEEVGPERYKVFKAVLVELGAEEIN